MKYESNEPLFRIRFDQNTTGQLGHLMPDWRFRPTAFEKSSFSFFYGHMDNSDSHCIEGKTTLKPSFYSQKQKD